MATIVQAAAFPYPTMQGSQVYVRGMAKALAKRGHRVIVAAYGHGEIEGISDLEYEVVRTPRVPFYNNLRAGPDLIKPALDLALAANLLRIGREADIVHAHNYEAPIAAYLSRLFTNVPVVYNNHNTMSEELHQYFKSSAAKRAATWLGGVLDRQVPRRADATVAISEEAVGLLRGFGCQSVSYVPPGVDPVDFEGADPSSIRRELGLNGRRWVVYAGNPDAYQDLDVLVDGVASLKDVGLIMVSASDLTGWRERSGLPPERLRLVQERSWQVTRDIISAADVAALPRGVCSGYPIKLLNYLGLGVPTVCCAGSYRPLPGVFVSPNYDKLAFGEKIEYLLSRDDLDQIGEQARENIRRNCSWDSRAAELELVYEPLLGL
jgi:glycosyltransferase involved in cell wall biosynthesis